jgi:hypothetical protein
MTLPLPHPYIPDDEPETLKELYDRVQQNFDRIALQFPVGIQHDTRKPHVSAYHDTTQSLNNSTLTPLVFNSEHYDSNAMHDLSTNNGRIKFPRFGAYHVGCYVGFAANSTGYRIVRIRLNGSTTLAQASLPTVNGDTCAVPLSRDYRFSEGDYVEVIAFQNSGGSLNVLAGAETAFWSHWVCP